MKIKVKIKHIEIELEENSIDKDKYASIRFNTKEIFEVLAKMTEECTKLYEQTK